MPRTRFTRGRYGRRYKRRRYNRAAIPYRSRGYLRSGGSYGRYKGAYGEMKWNDVNISAIDPVVGGTISQPLPDIANGTNDQSRIGKRIVLRKIEGRCYCRPQNVYGVTVSSPLSITVILLLDTQCNGSLPSVADILNTGAAHIQLAYNNLDNSARFRTLKRWTFTPQLQLVWNGTTYQGIQQPVMFSYMKKCRIPIEYSGTSGVVGEIRSNNLVMLTISNFSTSSQMRMDWEFRVRFTDS